MFERAWLENPAPAVRGVLDAPLSEAQPFGPADSAWRALVQWARGQGRPTARLLAEAMNVPTRHGFAYEAFLGGLARALENAHPTDPHALRDRMSLAELDAWVARQDTPGLAEVMVMPVAQLRTIYPDLYVYAENLRLAYNLAGGRRTVERVLERLRARAARRAAFDALKAQPPTDPVVLRLWSAVVARREALAEAYPADVDVRLHPDPPIASVFAHYERLRFDLVNARWLDSVQPSVEVAVYDHLLPALSRPTPGEPLYEALRTPAWARDLAAVTGLLAAVEIAGARQELGWRIDARNDGTHRIRAVLCRRTRTGTWDSARATAVPLALRADPVDDELAQLLTPERDLPAALWFRAFELLVGHPRAIREKRAIPVVRGALALALEPRPDGSLALAATIGGAPASLDLLSALAHYAEDAPGIVLHEEERVVVVRVGTARLALLRDGAHRLSRIPPEAFDAVTETFERWGTPAGITLPPALSGESVAGDLRPLLRLTAGAGAVTLEVRLRPLVDALPYPPGEGPETLYARRDGRRVSVARALAREAEEVHAALPWLHEVEPAAPWSWAFRLDVAAERDRLLALLEAAQAEPDRFQAEWSGELVRLAAPVRRAKLVLGSERDWLALSGNADGADTAALLAAVAEGAHFVEVGRGTWARIDATLRAAILPVARAAAVERTPRITALQAALLADAPASVEVTGAAVVLQRLAEIRRAGAWTPDVPAGLAAALRPYQVDGWRWLARLAAWAPGAILADDMGLGKTLQAIALLLHRAELGPALVIAPTSVVPNWQSELARFAPSLSVRVFHGAERSLEAAGPGVVYLTTWGLAQRDPALAAAHWRTLVLDEAQAIKNPDALRTRAVAGFTADFRLAMTGTPVENSALDLFSLLSVVSPGLLPGREGFRSRWLAPIEARDPAARAALAATTRPFVLRRTKAEVARELPAKTEVVVHVALSEDERLLYERARLRALAGLGEGQADRFRLLAALTRLRQLACHPRLVDAASPLRSSKLHTLARMLADLRAAGQRALVFSQFVELLDLVQPELAAGGLRTLRLDGSTPMAARQAAVAAFQAGQADVFLISLKAGGAGLNLTAATYVFHLDPWWNPAAEDQATDRAHRLGQDQPVTVYRLVATGTIEEAILGLHADKRTLAADLLSGSDSARPLAVEELVALLSGHSAE